MKGTSGYNSKGDDLFCSGQAGMLGIAVDPNFKKNRILRQRYYRFFSLPTKR